MTLRQATAKNFAVYPGKPRGRFGAKPAVIIEMEVPMPAPEQTPNWQPIGFLPSLGEMIDGMLESAEDVRSSLQQARAKPHVMDDYTIGRVRKVHGAQLGPAGASVLIQSMA